MKRRGSFLMAPAARAAYDKLVAAEKKRAATRAAKKKNPTKLQRMVNASKRSKQKRVATALKKYLQQSNPGAKLAGAKVQKLAGGVIKITPIKANRGRR